MHDDIDDDELLKESLLGWFHLDQGHSFLINKLKGYGYNDMFSPFVSSVQLSVCKASLQFFLDRYKNA